MFRLAQSCISGDDLDGVLACFLQQILIREQITETQIAQAVLPCAEELAETAQPGVFFGELETITLAADDTQPLTRLRRRHARNEIEFAGDSAPADSATQLMQLRQAKAIRVLDDHQRRIGNIDANLDYHGRHQQIELMVAEELHHTVLLIILQAAM